MTTTYTGIVRGKFIYDGSKTIDEMIDSLLDEANQLKAYRDAGAFLSEEADQDLALIATDDPEIAKRFGFKPSSTE